MTQKFLGLLKKVNKFTAKLPFTGKFLLKGRIFFFLNTRSRAGYVISWVMLMCFFMAFIYVHAYQAYIGIEELCEPNGNLLTFSIGLAYFLGNGLATISQLYLFLKFLPYRRKYEEEKSKSTKDYKTNWKELVLSVLVTFAGQAAIFTCPLLR